MPMRLLRSKTAIPPALVSFVLLGLVLVVLLWFWREQQSAQRWVEHTLVVKEDLSSLMSLMQDAETGQRGYLLTNESPYLEPYTLALSEYGPGLDELQRELADNKIQQDNLAELRQRIQRRLELLNEGIIKHDAGDTAGAARVVADGRGKVEMDAVRAIIARMKASEDGLLVERQAEAASTAQWLFTCVIVAIILVLTLASLSITQARQRRAEIEQARDVLQKSNDKLIAEIANREKIEHQLRQAQKMEALGQLTGGVAHDFNNMLAIIVGALNILRRRLERGEKDIGSFIDAALQGAHRATQLTQRLLAFSRQQALEPQALDSNKLISGMSDLLRRTLGEIIQVEIVLAGGLWKTFVDPGQLESAVLNIAVNARDAMGSGGKLTIETANAYLDENYESGHADVKAGQYVLISITDTGPGMDPEVIAKAFDPFFTTKAPGKGTGLGLSQVHGFVKQSGGHVKIYSEPNQGTTLKIYMPRYHGDAEEALERRPGGEEQMPQAKENEVVLVVEDEEAVRMVTVEGLRDLGYTVLHASGAAEALRLLEANPGVTLLFTDVVMPEINGRQLADQARKLYPTLKVVFTTGYTRNAVVHNGILDAGVKLLGKPFTLYDLARAIRDGIDAR